jgi:CBS domain-containing protein
VIDASVSQMMRHDTRSVTRETPIGDVARILSDDALSSVPVVEDGRVVGVVGQSDLLFQELQEEESRLPQGFPILGAVVFLEPVDRWRDEVRKAFGVTAGDVMESEPVTVAPDTPAHEAARLMVDRDVNRLPVVDGEGRVVGVISRADIVRALAAEW